jgi:hypothetical protein
MTDMPMEDAIAKVVERYFLNKQAEKECRVLVDDITRSCEGKSRKGKACRLPVQ